MVAGRALGIYVARSFSYRSIWIVQSDNLPMQCDVCTIPYGEKEPADDVGCEDAGRER